MFLENENIMAAAEARTAWQRASNRCLVQEDAKRAPKLACCPSSSAEQVDSNNINATNGQEQYISSFVPINWNYISSNLPSDSKWWLQLQPSFGYQRDFMLEPPKGTPNEHGEANETIIQASFTDEAMHGGYVESENEKDCPLEPAWMVTSTSMKYGSEMRMQEMKAVTANFSQQALEPKLDVGTCYFGEELSGVKPVDQLTSKKTTKTNVDMEMPWERSNKCEPWWRVLDKEELVSLVAQKSSENIENCDLPRPAHMCKNPITCLESWEGNRGFAPSLGGNLDASKCRLIDHSHHAPTFSDMDGKSWYSDHAHGPPLETEKLCSNSWSSNTSATVLSEGQPNSENNASRNELLEALCHSQTRARKAEMAAQKSHEEKEHILKLLFKQASHLFAYKQWLQVLQLESLCLQHRIKDYQSSTVFPILPWMPLRGKPAATGRGEARRKVKRQKCTLCRYALLFAVGLGLAGAGLFLGCFLGWLSPTV